MSKTYRIAKMSNMQPGDTFFGEITSSLADFEGVWIHQVNRGLDHCIGSITRPFEVEILNGQNHIFLELIVNQGTEIHIAWEIRNQGQIVERPDPVIIDLNPGENIFIWYFKR